MQVAICGSGSYSPDDYCDKDSDGVESMALMDDQYFSQVFRKRYEKFNGLIWAYHWLQVGLYEPFIEGNTKAAKKAGVQATPTPMSP